MSSRFIGLPIVALCLVAQMTPAMAMDCLTMDTIGKGSSTNATFNNPVTYPNGARMMLWVGEFKTPSGEINMDNASIVENTCLGPTTKHVLHANADNLYGVISNAIVTKLSFKVCNHKPQGNLTADTTAFQFIGDITSVSNEKLQGPGTIPVSATATGISGNTSEILFEGKSISEFGIGGFVDIIEICLE